MISYGDRVNQAVDYLVIWLRIKAPKESWNLTNNGIRKAYNGIRFTWEIIIGGEPAPYAIYTNEPWIAEKWHGAVNPNQGWVQKAVAEAKPILIGLLSGAISKEDYKRMMIESGNQLKQMSIQAGVNIS